MNRCSESHGAQQTYKLMHNDSQEDRTETEVLRAGGMQGRGSKAQNAAFSDLVGFLE